MGSAFCTKECHSSYTGGRFLVDKTFALQLGFHRLPSVPKGLRRKARFSVGLADWRGQRRGAGRRERLGCYGGGLSGALFSFTPEETQARKAASRDSNPRTPGRRGGVHPLERMPGVNGARGRASSGRPGRWPAGRSAGAALSFYVRAGPGTPCPGPRPANNAPFPAARPAAAPRPLPAPRPPGSEPEPCRPRRYSGSRPGRRRGPGKGRGAGGRGGSRWASVPSRRTEPAAGSGGTGPLVLRGPGARGTQGPSQSRTVPHPAARVSATPAACAGRCDSAGSKTRDAPVSCSQQCGQGESSEPHTSLNH